MGNGFTLNSAASNLIDLTLGMLAKSAQVSQPCAGDFIVVFQDFDTGLRALKIDPCQINVVLVGLLDLQFFRGLFVFIFRGLMLELLQLAIQVFELTKITFMISPAWQNMLRMPFSTHMDQGTYGVIQQVDIGGKMHVCF